MALKWFDTKKVDEFAEMLVAELTKRVPPKVEGTQKRLLLKLSKVHGALLDRASEFVESQRPNFYQKARLGNHFKWRLKDAGYPEDFVNAWTYELVTFVTLKSRQAKPKP